MVGVGEQLQDTQSPVERLGGLGGHDALSFDGLGRVVATVPRGPRHRSRRFGDARRETATGHGTPAALRGGAATARVHVSGQ
ncbi:hypothetical protein GCM10023082_38220 [Streptomyces tremellae]|uniref:Uncharacterized protein n=1 Tax=Streptomyces tremellae TaxID=1124239 RepID=A0ABP7FHE8_9ACTN